MQIAICDDEKSIGLILEEKIKKLLPDAVIYFWIFRCQEWMEWKRQGFCVRKMKEWY